MAKNELVQAALAEIDTGDFELKPLSVEAAAKKAGVNSFELAQLPGKPTTYDFNWAVDNAWVYFQSNGRMPTPDELATNSPFDPSREALLGLYNYQGFHDACRLRGIRSSNSGLDARMLATLAAVVDISSKAGLDTRLRRVGVTPAEYQTWLNYKPFKDKLDLLSDKLYRNAESNIKLKLTEMAMDGKLDAIKYHDLRTGNFDPNAKAVVDSQAFLKLVIEIVQEVITDPNVLMTLYEKLSAAATKAGIT